MPDIWNDHELDSCVRTYLWMLRCVSEGHKLVKARVRAALLAGPLSNRTGPSIEYRFQNISAVLQQHGEQWLPGYVPAKNVGSETAEKIWQLIQAYRNNRHARSQIWLIRGIPTEIVHKATEMLPGDESFDFPDSTFWDATTDTGDRMPPKKVIGYAALLHYGAPLNSDDFKGGIGTACFDTIKSAGVSITIKADPSSKEFRKAVSACRRKGLKRKPKGCRNPPKVESTTSSYSRDPEVVTWVEDRAKGRCELCGCNAPFKRPDSTPYLEVHHVEFLAAGGPDTPDNAVGLCPNCHRECHHGEKADQYKAMLKERLAT